MKYESRTAIPNALKHTASVFEHLGTDQAMNLSSLVVADLQDHLIHELKTYLLAIADLHGEYDAAPDTDGAARFEVVEAAGYRVTNARVALADWADVVDIAADARTGRDTGFKGNLQATVRGWRWD